MLTAQTGLAAARDLQAKMRGKVLLPRDSADANPRPMLNGAAGHDAALLALCEIPGDVQAAVSTARNYGLPLTLCGGGRDWASRWAGSKGLMVDLSRMRQVEVDAGARIATVAGGATAGDVAAAAAPHGMAPVTSSIGEIGMASLILSGGYGPLNARYGLALDSLLDMELVLADGRSVTASAREHIDLFWALRGGGNFGVVTSMRIRLHAVPELLAGLILFPWSQAGAVFRGYAEAVRSAPDKLAVDAGIMEGPDGGPAVFLVPVWTGDPLLGQAIMEQLQGLGTPILAQTGPLTYSELLGIFDAKIVKGCHYSLQTAWIPSLTPKVIAALILAGNNRTSRFTAIVLHQFRGAATRVPPEATAFGLRREHFLVEVIAAWEPGLPDDSGTPRPSTCDLSAGLAPVALPGDYPNLLGLRAADQIPHPYGSNIGPLQEIRRRFDPDGLFSAAPLLD
jgi:hypothetical protein